MAFDIPRLVEFCTEELRRFGERHGDELFYAFAIDASLLCLNSEEAAAAILKQYRESWERQTLPIETWDSLSEEDLRESEWLLSFHEKQRGLERSNRGACLAVINGFRQQKRGRGNPYLDTAEVGSLRDNTGDWAYQGFAEMTDEVGFDEGAYDEHYYLDEEEQLSSAYGVAMDELLVRLRQAGAFSVLKLSPGFIVKRVEHD